MWLSDNSRVLDWWLDLLNTYTARDYTLQITITRRLVFSVMFLGNGFQQLTFPCFWAHVLAGLLATISRQPHTLTAGFSRYFLQLLAPRLNLQNALQTASNGWLAAKLLLALASTAILGSESHRTHDHILLSLLLMVKVKVTLQATISQSVSPGFEPHLGLMTGH
jgi:hypothetical protein